VLARKTRPEAFIDPLRRCGRTIRVIENRTSVLFRAKRRSCRAPTHPSSERSDGTTSVHETVGLLNTLHLEKSTTWAHVSHHTRQTFRAPRLTFFIAPNGLYLSTQLCSLNQEAIS
jgi:hypothetical protein